MVACPYPVSISVLLLDKNIVMSLVLLNHRETLRFDPIHGESLSANSAYLKEKH